MYQMRRFENKIYIRKNYKEVAALARTMLYRYPPVT